MKLVCISDTHGHHRKLKLPKGDVLVHAGDMSRGKGSIDQVNDFSNWLSELDFDHIVITPGNHDFPFEKDLPLVRAMMNNCHLLIDQEVVIDGVKFYGSPWQPAFHNWAYNLERGAKLAKVWANIPNDTDVLITHGPPKDILDFTFYDQTNVGCEELAKRILELRPKPLVHIFGHIHECYGTLDLYGTKFINASSCNLQYQPFNQPIVVEI